LRERRPGEVERIVKEGLNTTGYEEVGLLSLSTGDYTSIGELLCGLMPRLEQEKISVSLPSLRVGTLDGKLASEIKRVRKTGFTLAPEAGSQRLRNMINKGIEEEALIKGAEEVFSLGWRSLKLYFMIGLPTETDEDILSILYLAKAVRSAGKGVSAPRVSAPRVNVSVSTFIPKPFTPFQWGPQVSRDYSLARQALLRREAKRMKLGFKWHDPGMSLLEGVFSRGDRRLSAVILRAFKKGCRFDGWTDEFRFDIWKGAFSKEGVEMEFYTGRKRGRDEVLPWDHLVVGLKKEFLYKEYERSLEHSTTHDCRSGECIDCGVCDNGIVTNRVLNGNPPAAVRKSRPAARQGPLRVRLSFSKTRGLKYLSHLELVKVITRAIRRAGLPVVYSQGHHPLPRIALSQPLPVGIESMDEYMDIELERGSPTPERIVGLLNSTLPAGLKVSDARFIPLQLPSLSAIMRAQRYLISLKNGPLGLKIDSKRIDGFVRDFLMMDSIVVHTERGGKSRDVDIKPLLGELSHVGDLTLGLMLKCVNGASVRPDEVLASLLNLSKEQASLIPICKTKTVF
jgi:radical SAM-linked protein